MAVGDKAAAARMENRRVVAHHGEVEKHLIDFRITVAADGQNLFLIFIKKRGEVGWIVTDRKHIAGAVVEVVAAEDEIVGVFAMEGFFGELEGVCGAVYVGGDEKAHDFN